MQVKIDCIKIQNRIREDMGDINDNFYLQPKINQNDCCIVCGYPFVDKHHLIPKELFGKDDETNIINLCPNHHRIFHFLIDFEHMTESGKLSRINKKEADKRLQLFKYILCYERKIYRFYKDYAKPHICEYLSSLTKEIKESEA